MWQRESDSFVDPGLVSSLSVPDEQECLQHAQFVIPLALDSKLPFELAHTWTCSCSYYVLLSSYFVRTSAHLCFPSIHTTLTPSCQHVHAPSLYPAMWRGNHGDWRFFELQYRAHGCFDGSYLFALSSFSHHSKTRGCLKTHPCSMYRCA